MSQAPIEGPSKTNLERQRMPEDNPSVAGGRGGGAYCGFQSRPSSKV